MSKVDYQNKLFPKKVRAIVLVKLIQIDLMCALI